MGARYSQRGYEGFRGTRRKRGVEDQRGGHCFRLGGLGSGKCKFRKEKKALPVNLTVSFVVNLFRRGFTVNVSILNPNHN